MLGIGLIVPRQKQREQKYVERTSHLASITLESQMQGMHFSSTTHILRYNQGMGRQKDCAAGASNVALAESVCIDLIKTKQWAERAYYGVEKIMCRA